jgi:C1A family cysteine protease
MADPAPDMPEPEPIIPSHIYSLKVNRLPEEELTFKYSPAFLAASAKPLPGKVDLRSRMAPIYDQGQLGSCTANALVAIFQYDAPTFMGSRLFLYYNERAMLKTTAYDSGAYLSDGIKSLKASGVCAESLWPYNIRKFTIKPPQACYTEASRNRVIVANNIPNTLAAMKASLVANEPFVIGFLVYASFESSAVAATGIVPMPRAGEQLLGGHAVVVCGYDDSKQWWIVRNSWGTRWGARGYFFVPYAYFLNPRLATDMWNITSIVRLAAPRATPMVTQTKVSAMKFALNSSSGPKMNVFEFMKSIRFSNEVTPEDAEVTPEDAEVTPEDAEVTPEDAEVTPEVAPEVNT